TLRECEGRWRVTGEAIEGGGADEGWGWIGGRLASPLRRGGVRPSSEVLELGGARAGSTRRASSVVARPVRSWRRVVVSHCRAASARWLPPILLLAASW